MPGERTTDAIAGRLKLELGLEAPDIAFVLPNFAYRSTDSSGIVENGLCPVYQARPVHPEPCVVPDRDEVMDWRLVEVASPRY